MTIYSPPINTYIPLAEITLASATSSITLSGYSQDYRDLILTVSGKTTSGSTQLKMQFNGDTSASYTYQQMYGEISTPGADSNTLTDIRAIMGATTGIGQVQYQIMDFSASNKHTTVLARENNVGIDWTSMRLSRWANTEAVTSITLTANIGNLDVGTQILLHGIEA